MKPKTAVRGQIILIRVVRKLQFPNNNHLKKRVLQPLGCETAKTVRKPTGFPNKSIILITCCALISACASLRVFERYTSGRYSGEAQGQSGTIRVLVETNTTSILDISVIQNTEDEHIGGAAIDELCLRILDTNTSDVDAISGATRTSEALIHAVKEALAKAKPAN